MCIYIYIYIYIYTHEITNVTAGRVTQHGSPQVDHIWFYPIVNSRPQCPCFIDTSAFLLPVGANSCLFSEEPALIWNPHGPKFTGYRRNVTSWVKRLGCEVDHSLPCSVEVKNEWPFTSTSPHAFMTCTHICRMRVSCICCPTRVTEQLANSMK